MTDTAPPPRTRIADLVAAARAKVEQLGVDDLREELAAGDVTLIDIRDVRERWDNGGIPGARSMPRGMLEFWFDPESPYFQDDLTTDGRYVLYCASGGRSALAAALQDLGYTNVAHLGAGFNGWKEADGEVEAVEPDPKYFRPND